MATSQTDRRDIAAVTIGTASELITEALRAGGRIFVAVDKAEVFCVTVERAVGDPTGDTPTSSDERTRG